jgi:peroxiredoxin
MLAKQIIVFLVVGLGAVFAAATEAQVQLPTVKPTLNVTATAALGTIAPGVGVKVGTKVADFAVNTHLGKPVTLKELLAQGRTMVVFYRGGWCPYCNVQIHALTEAWPAFQQRKVTPVLISVDRPDASSLAQRRYEIPFPVLSDPDLHAHQAFKVVLDVDAATVKKYQGYGIDLEQWSGRDHHKIAVAAVFLLDSDGVVQWAHASKDFKTRPSPEQLLAVIDGLAP